MLHGENSNQSRWLQKSLNNLFRIVFSRTMIIVLLLLVNFLLVFSFIFDLFQGLPILFGSMVVFTAIMELFVLNTREDPTVKLSWCVIIAVLPLFGACLYFFVRFDLGHRAHRHLVNSSIQSSLPYSEQDHALSEKIRKNEPHLYHIMQYLDGYGHFPVYERTETTYFPLGEDMFREMLIQLEKAEKFIFMEYFLVARGQMWDSILEILQRKAKQGVEVRVMYDGMCAFMNLPYDYPRELEKMGIRCKMFSPVRPFVSTHYNNRDHRKITVIDGHTAFTGGINLEDCYINREVRYGHWKDTAVMVRGNAAQGFTRIFLQLWNASEKQRVFEPYLTLPETAPEAQGYVIPYADSPTDADQVGEMVYLNILNQALQYVYIMTPYLILDDKMATAIKFAAQRGTDVRIVLPHIPDKQSAFLLAKSHYEELIGAGVRIYEYTPGFVHGKVFLCDDTCGVVGTINLDYRSLYHHFECGAYLYKVDALADIKADFTDTMEKSQEITMEDVKKQSLFTRISGKLLKIAAPLM